MPAHARRLARLSRCLPPPLPTAAAAGRRRGYPAGQRCPHNFAWSCIWVRPPGDGRHPLCQPLGSRIDLAAAPLARRPQPTCLHRRVLGRPDRGAAGTAVPRKPLRAPTTPAGRVDAGRAQGGGNPNHRRVGIGTPEPWPSPAGWERLAQACIVPLLLPSPSDGHCSQTPSRSRARGTARPRIQHPWRRRARCACICGRPRGAAAAIWGPSLSFQPAHWSACELYSTYPGTWFASQSRLHLAEGCK